ncbi:hypothetical protein M33023_00520 [Candidatus Phytoplasma asteris]|uniref:Sequence-variable mosaic (SVM) signal sequence domain-containing protein n=1 Tax=Candidatus Phytoplasma asteris TaxID=85620 RepID=A0ABZ2YG46_9MOLU
MSSLYKPFIYKFRVFIMYILIVIITQNNNNYIMYIKTLTKNIYQ